MNDAMLSELGYTKEEVIGRNYLSTFVPTREHEAVSKVFEAIAQDESPTIYQSYVTAKDAHEALVQWNGRPFFNKHGELDFISGSGIDITEQKKTEQALADSESRYRLYAHNVRDVLWVLDNDLRYVYISPSVEMLRGYTVQESLNVPLEKVFTPKSYRKIIRMISDIRDVLAKGEPLDPKTSLTLELEQVCKDGSTRWTEVIASLLRDDNGNQVGFLGITRDINERKQAEDSLRTSEEHYRAIFENTGNATVIIEDDTTISLANTEFERLSGYLKHEIEGKKSWTEFVLSEDLDRMIGYHNIRRQDPNAAPRNYDFRFIDRHGRIKDVYATATIISGTKTSLVSLLDISERKQAEEHLRLSREQLRNLHIYTQELREQERARVAREIHDELGQVLTAFKMDLSYLSRKLPKEQPVLKAKTGSMIKSIDSSIETVRRIIMDLRPGLLDHLGLIPAIEWQTEEFMKRTGIKCSLEISPQGIHLDGEISTTIFRIFQEALTNVARHAKATFVNISLSLGGDLLMLRIHDNGIGITKNQIDNPRSFGLMGMRERSLFCNGSFDILNENTGGTTVIVGIPLSGMRKIDDTSTGS